MSTDPRSGLFIEHTPGIYPSLTITSMQALNRAHDRPVFEVWLSRMVAVELDQLRANLMLERRRLSVESQLITFTLGQLDRWLQVSGRAKRMENRR